MATVGIWKIENRLDKVLSYTTDEVKTYNDSYLDLHNVLKYAKDDFKTEQQHFVSGINCSHRTAYSDMISTKEHFNKNDGILGYHAFQSFKENEVSPDLAHQVGIRLAKEMWGDRFEVVVSTHSNTKNIHNHFVINSVSFVDGKKFYDKRETYSKLRALNDSICEEYGLSFLKEKVCRKTGINYGNYYQKYTSHNNYYTTAKEDIDRAIGQAYSYKDFEKLLRAMNYDLIYRAGKLSVRRSPYKKNIRVHRCFGIDYTLDKIEERIKTTHSVREPFIEEYGNNKKYIQYENYPKQKAKGLYALCLHYCYLLKVFPQKNPKKLLLPEIRADIKKLDEITIQTDYLVKHKIIRESELIKLISEYKKNYTELKSEREYLWIKFSRSNDDLNKEKIKKQIELLTNKINLIKEELDICDSISKRIEQIKINLEMQYEEKERKER